MYCVSPPPVSAPPLSPNSNFAVTLDFAVCADAVFDWYNNAPCGYQLLDADGRFLQINNTALRWLGHTRDALVSCRCFSEFLPPASLEAFRQCLLDLQARGAVRERELQLRRADGSVLDISLSAIADFNDDGIAVRSRFTLVDISRQKAAEAKLSAHEHAATASLPAQAK